MRKICPRCGAGSDRKKFMGLFCEDCYAEHLNIKVEKSVTLEVCKKCGRLRTGKEWITLNQRSIEKQLERAVKGDYETMRFVIPQSGEGTVQVVFIVRAGDDFLEAVKQLELIKRSTICEDDSRASAGYFEAIVQIRCPDPERTARLTEKIKKEVSRKSFVAKIVESKHGTDLYVGSNKVVMETLRAIDLHSERSATLHGVKDGQRIYRTTYCVRG